MTTKNMAYPIRPDMAHKVPVEGDLDFDATATDYTVGSPQYDPRPEADECDDCGYRGGLHDMSVEH